MEEGCPLFIGEDGPGPRRFVGVGKDMGKGDDREDTIFMGADDEGAAGVGATEDQQGRRADLVVPGEFFNDFMNNFAIFYADDEYTAQSCFCVFHGVFSDSKSCFRPDLSDPVFLLSWVWRGSGSFPLYSR